MPVRPHVSPRPSPRPRPHHRPGMGRAATPRRLPTVVEEPLDYSMGGDTEDQEEEELTQEEEDALLY